MRHKVSKLSDIFFLNFALNFDLAKGRAPALLAPFLVAPLFGNRRVTSKGHNLLGVCFLYNRFR